MMLMLPRTGDGGIARVVERQMRNWELARSQQGEAPGAKTAEVEHFVTISRVVGAGGDEVARRLAEKLGWPLFDREILQTMAGDDQVRARLYAAMDERDQGWLEEMVQAASQTEPVRDDYFHRLHETVLALARKGHAVFLGRAADLILPRGRGFRLRLMASWDVCVANYVQQHNVTHEAADRAIRRIDRDRGEFIRHHFHRPADDPSRHDLILNLSSFTPQEAADLTLAAMRIKGIIDAEHDHGP